MLKRIVPALAALAAAAPALAGDLPSYKGAPVIAPVAYDWTGLYIGADIGGAWARARFTPAGIPGININSSSFMGGGFIGYNRALGNNFIIGAEGDVQGLGVNRWDPTLTYRVRQGVLGAINARLGYAFDRVLVYAIGGFAFSDSGYTNTGLVYRDNGVGFDVGGGVEYAFLPNWTVRGEYRYYDFGHVGKIDPNNAFFGIAKTESTFRAGVAYKFGAPVVAPVVAAY